MTQDKELLLKDLCARLPYGVKLQKTYDTSDPVELYLIDLGHDIIKFYTYKGECLTMCDVGDIERFGKLRYKPYLFPLSSMTEEQKEELKDLISQETNFLIEQLKNDDCGIDCGKYHFHSTLELEWLLKNHFDFRGLIPKGIAIDATNLNIY
jgi:hypothetical protein